MSDLLSEHKRTSPADSINRRNRLMLRPLQRSVCFAPPPNPALYRRQLATNRTKKDRWQSIYTFRLCRFEMPHRRVESARLLKPALRSDRQQLKIREISA